MNQRVNARRLQKRVELFQKVAIGDGFGGSTINSVLVNSYWTEFKSSKSSGTNTDLTALGIQDFSMVYTLTIRDNVQFNDPKLYDVVYKGFRYEVLSIKRIDLRGTKTELIVRQYPDN